MENKCCHIIGAGDFSPELLEIHSGDAVIACDGGFLHLANNRLPCHYCIGDFDSLGHIPNGEFQTTVLPSVKDVTDTHAACNKALELGFKSIKIYGALGGERFSHSIANLQLLCKLRHLGCKAMIIDKNCKIIPIENEKVTFSHEETGYISLFSMSNSLLYSCHGLKYTVTDHQIDNLFALGISNEFTGQPSYVKIEGGMGVLIMERK